MKAICYLRLEKQALFVLSLRPQRGAGVIIAKIVASTYSNSFGIIQQSFQFQLFFQFNESRGNFGYLSMQPPIFAVMFSEFRFVSFSLFRAAYRRIISVKKHSIEQSASQGESTMDVREVIWILGSLDVTG